MSSVENLSHTPLPVIANVTRICGATLDRLTGDRSEVPLLSALAVHTALSQFEIKSQIQYGRAAWLEVLENQSIQWAGCWGDSIYFWCVTEFGEVVDLNLSVNYKKRGHGHSLHAICSPPILWSQQIPNFCKYEFEGLAEIELTEEKDGKLFETIEKEIKKKCGPAQLTEDEEFLNEPYFIGQKGVLDDSKATFKLFDRNLKVTGIPESPF